MSGCSGSVTGDGGATPEGGGGVGVSAGAGGDGDAVALVVEPAELPTNAWDGGRCCNIIIVWAVLLSLCVYGLEFF